MIGLAAFLGRMILFAGGVGAVWAESQHWHTPGVGFVLAMVLIVLAMLPWRRG